MKPLALALILILLTCIRPSTGAASPCQIEAVGFAAQTPQKTLADLHREALQDALKNALLKAHVELQIEARVEGMALQSQTLTVRSRGVIQYSRILQAGFMKDHPTIYQIHLEARVIPAETNQTDRE